jgi:Uma2 family endonuclease
MAMRERAAAPIGLDSPPPPPGPVSFETFLAWASGAEVRAEWIDGEIIIMSPARPGHERLTVFLVSLLTYVAGAGELGEVFTPLAMRLPSRRRGRVPDILFIANEHADRVRETHVEGGADLVVEIVSPDSVKRDYEEKPAEYAAARIGEYWLIDPLAQRAIFYQLQPDGRYAPGPIDAKGRYHSIVMPGFWLDVAWLWQRPLPALATLIKQYER